MSDVVVGQGNFRGKGVYANRDFRKGEVVVSYDLVEMTRDEFLGLPKGESAYVHSFWGRRWLFRGTSRYVNHSRKPTTYQDLARKADVALGDIKKGDPITTDGGKEIQNELCTFLDAYERGSVDGVSWLKKGYRNAICAYATRGTKKTVTLKRIDGNWEVIDASIVAT